MQHNNAFSRRTLLAGLGSIAALGVAACGVDRQQGGVAPTRDTAEIAKTSVFEVGKFVDRQIFHSPGMVDTAFGPRILGSGWFENGGPTRTSEDKNRMVPTENLSGVVPLAAMIQDQYGVDIAFISGATTLSTEAAQGDIVAVLTDKGVAVLHTGSNGEFDILADFKSFVDSTDNVVGDLANGALFEGGKLYVTVSKRVDDTQLGGQKVAGLGHLLAFDVTDAGTLNSDLVLRTNDVVNPGNLFHLPNDEQMILVENGNRNQPNPSLRFIDDVALGEMTKVDLAALIQQDFTVSTSQYQNSSDGRYVWLGSAGDPTKTQHGDDDRAFVMRYDIDAGTHVKKDLGLGLVNDIQFLPDGRVVVSLKNERAVVTLELEGGELVEKDRESFDFEVGKLFVKGDYVYVTADKGEQGGYFPIRHQKDAA